MSSIYEAYQEEWRSLEGSIEKELSVLKMCTADEGDSTTTIRQLSGLISQSNDLVKQMEIEVRSTAGADKKLMSEKVAQFKRSLKNLSAEFSAQKTRLSRSSLMSGADGPALGKSAEQRQRLLETNEKLSRQNEHILNAQRTVAETEEVGIEITEELARNRERIQASRDRVGEFLGLTDNARRMIGSMQRRAMQSRFFTTFIFVILTVAVILGIYYMVKHNK
jgi:hypothetical protein